MISIAKPSKQNQTKPIIAINTQGSDFTEAADITFTKFEGGEVNDPNDPGGHTKFGISQRAYPNEDITALTPERARFLAKRDYWFPMRLDMLNCQTLSNNLFDFAFHHGVRGVCKKLQLMLAREFNFNGDVDGIMGNQTISFLNGLISASSQAPFAIHLAMVRVRLQYYLQYSDPKYLTGFLTRAVFFL